MPRPRAVIGPASLLESADRPAWWTPPGRPHRLEALIGDPQADGTLRIEHWFCGQHRPDNPWVRGDAISDRALAPAALTQRGRPGTAAHELVAYVPEADGLIEYAWAVNQSSPMRWRRVGAAPAVPAPRRPAWDGPEHAAEWGGGTVIATATAATRLRSGWVQALVQVDDSLYHLHRQQHGQRVRWVRHACLRLRDHDAFEVAPEPSVKLAQVTGERDSQPRPGSTGATLSSSESVAGVRGADLGVRVEADGRSFLLFGDTHWTRPWLGTRDSIAEVRDASAERPDVVFHGSPLSIRGGGTTLREYDVPLDAFSLEGRQYAFFTSNHFRDAQVMGRSVLTRAPRLRIDPRARRRPLRFGYLGTLSTHRFINVSAQRVGDQLYLWGSGAYRADDLRLAGVDLTVPGLAQGLRAGNAAPLLAAVRYWAGPQVETSDSVIPANAGISTPRPTVSTSSTGGAGSTDSGQAWSTREADARPLFTPGAHGEVSVRWVSQVRRYLMLTMSGPDDTIGPAVVLRWAANPWGPWSSRLRLFDWIDSGMSFGDPAHRFIKAMADGSDPVGDAIFRGQSTATGAAYAPYFYDARVEGDALVLRYTLSTWNPYQVVLMQHRLELARLATEQAKGGSDGPADQVR